MTKYKVLISPNTLLPVLEDYRYILIKNNIQILTPPPFNEYLTEDELLPLVSDIDGAICGDDRFTENVFSKAKKLKVLSKWGEGLNAIDLEAAKKYNIKVFRTAGALTDPVADTVLGYLLAFARNLIQKDIYMKKGEWRKLGAVTLKESKLGIIGYGKIGQAVAKRAVSFGMQVMVYDINPIRENNIDNKFIKIIDLNTIYQESDFISLNCDLNKTSKKIIDKYAIKKKMKKAVSLSIQLGEN